MEQPSELVAVQERLPQGTRLTARAFLFLPRASSLIYVVAAVLLKRAAVGGGGVWRTAFVGNLIGALFFLPLLALGGGEPPWSRLWQPAVVALLMVAGQCASLWSLTRGDVSVATPVMGLKIVLVAFFTTVIADAAVPLRLWVAAALSTVAIGLMNRAGSSAGRHHDLVLTILGALLAAVAFALFDVLVMSWSPAWGAGRFLPIMTGLAALFSFAFIPWFQGSWRRLPRTVWSPLFWGSALVALQGVILVSAVAVFGEATAINVVYSTRGVWSVVLVWTAGTWLGSDEGTRGSGILGWRLAGAGLMTVAVVTVFL